MSRLGPGCDTRAYIWPRSWRKLETLTAPIRPECAFDPKAILGSHACDQSLKLYRDCWAAPSFFMRGSPPPVRPPIRSLPAQNCFRFHNQQRMPPIAEPSACQDPKAPIGVAQARPRMPPLEHNQLLAQTKVLRD
jgi:hypothetical protein